MFFLSLRRVFWVFFGPVLRDFGALLRLLLAGNGALRTLTGTGVGLGALTTHGQTTTVAQALVAADLDLATDVGLNLAAKVTLDLERLLDVLAELCQVLVREVLAPEIRADAGGVKDFLERVRPMP
ncbi:hypothetical protein GCM10020255_065070 [Rhodococcus baikonurensis]